MRIYYEARQQVIDALEDRPPEYFDYLICEIVVEAFDFQAIIGTQVARTPKEVKLKLSSAIANVTVLCVTMKHQNCIDCIQLVDEGPIER